MSSFFEAIVTAPGAGWGVIVLDAFIEHVLHPAFNTEDSIVTVDERINEVPALRGLLPL